MSFFSYYFSRILLRRTRRAMWRGLIRQSLWRSLLPDTCFRPILLRRTRRVLWRGRISLSLWLSLFYLITRSALAKTLGGIVRPICLAAFRLMMNSNFIGCSTGRSAGFLPFRILSTYVAARRSKSVTLTP